VQLLRIDYDPQRKLLPLRKLREYERVFVVRGSMGRFVLCVRNNGYSASLELWKVYRLLSDEKAAKRYQVRVIDESGEDYLYPEEYFVPIKLPQAAERAVLRGG